MTAPVKKIGIYIGQLHFGGAEKQSLFLAEALKDKYEVEFIVFKGHRIENSYEKQLQKWQIPYYFLKGYSLFRVFKLYKIFRKKKYQAVFCYLPADQVIGTIIARLSGIKYVIGGIRNTKIVKKKFIITKKIQNRFQDYIIFNSQKALDIYCGNGYRKDKSLVIENTVLVDDNYVARIKNEKVKILMVGRFVTQKDYQNAVKAISYLYHDLKIQNIRFIIAGFGEMETEIREWLKIYKIESVTDIHLKPDNLTELYRTSDLMLNSSIFEGMSNSIMEATSYGLPVVATETGDIQKLVTDGKSGYIVPVGDYKAMAEKLSILCSDSEKRVQFSRAAYKNLKNNYSFDRFKEKYKNFVLSLT
ncbi:MAG: glycosyltransferase [Bacteroidales bacterium]|nr:glycosyltransferase [Bacteroidales bacterium]